jgi:hypothetical protein
VDKEILSTYMGARMRFVRVAAGATALLVLGASSSIGSAGAVSTGFGTSKSSTTVLNVGLGTAGSLLNVRILGDDARSTTDAKTASAPEAFSRLTALQTSSGLVPALNIAVPSSPYESRQPGGTPEVSASSVDLSNPGTPVPAGFANAISGNLNLAKLTSAVDSAGARSAVTAVVTNAKLAGGLVSAQAVDSTLATEATSAKSTSTRSVNVDAVSVLDLGALLDGLDIKLSDLSVTQIDALLAALKGAIPGLDPAATLQSTIDAIQLKITDLTTNPLVAGTAQTVVDALQLGGVIPPGVVTGITGTAQQQTNALIDALQAALADVLENGLKALDDLVLLKLDGVKVSVSTKAADTLGNSAADVTGKIGAVHVGGITLPAIDLVQAADTINAAVKTVNDKIGAALDTIKAPVGRDIVSLKALVNVEVLKQTKSVSTIDGYNVAQAGITGVSATVTPPADLAAIVSAIKAQAAGPNSIAAAILAEGGAVPALSTGMGALESTLGSSVQAVQGGAGVQAVVVQGSSDFRQVATSTTTGTGNELPRTGGDSIRLAALGMLLVALGLGLVSWYRMPLPIRVRRRLY